MDKLLKIAKSFQSIMQMQYYFEIAKKQKVQKFILTFEKADFHHIAGLHKLKDVTVLQKKTNKMAIFDSICKGDILFSQIENSFFYNDIEKRISYLEMMQEVLDNNQAVFRYLENKNGVSHIKADYLLEEGYNKDILYMFLSERHKTEQRDIPIMCCRSFFPMSQLDYTKNQPSYTLLKKIRVDTVTGERVVQYDRSKILDQAKAAPSETERKSILAQLNEKRAQIAIRNVLEGKQELRKDKQEHAR